MAQKIIPNLKEISRTKRVSEFTGSPYEMRELIFLLGMDTYTHYGLIGANLLILIPPEEAAGLVLSLSGRDKYFDTLNVSISEVYGEVDKSILKIIPKAFLPITFTIVPPFSAPEKQ